MKNEKITIREIAERSGVSISTVSRVINQYKNISEDVRARVMAVIEETNFVPNSAAVSMVKKRTNLLVVIVPHILNPFFTTLIHVIEEEAKKEGYYTIVFSTDDSEEAEKEFLKTIGNTVDGVLTVTSIGDVSYLNSYKKKTVLIDRAVENCMLDSVTFDHFHALYDAVEYLISMGHKKIAFITGIHGIGIADERLAGYRQALKDAGIEEEKGYVRRKDWYSANGYESTMELLKSENPPTAILAGNNMICEGAMQALAELGLAWGTDISLIGFEESDTDLFEKAGVTVVKLDALKLGRKACRILLDALNNEDMDETYGRRQIRSTMIFRDSVRNLEKQGKGT